jgi:dTMP kinase
MFDAIRSVLIYSWQRYDYIIFVRYLMGAAYIPSPMHKFAYRFFALLVPKSDAMFFLDTTPEVAYRRIREGRKTREMFEDIDSLKNVRAKGLSLASIGAWTVIDADRTPSEVELEIRKHLRLGRGPAVPPPMRR